MRFVLLWALLCASTALASGQTVCLEWADAGPPAESPDGSVADRQGTDADAAALVSLRGRASRAFRSRLA